MTDEAPQQKTNSVPIGLIVVALLVVLGIGIAAFKGYASKPTENNTPLNSQSSVSSVTSNISYKDGVYSAEGDYVSPGGPEQIQVKLTLKGNIVVDANVVSEATREKSKHFQGLFTDNFKPLVIGKNINDIVLDKVSGSSLTPKGFNDAVQKIKTEAQS